MNDMKNYSIHIVLTPSLSYLAKMIQNKNVFFFRIYTYLQSEKLKIESRKIHKVLLSKKNIKRYQKKDNVYELTGKFDF